jgi:hydroxyacylglutathione hydrolase
VNRLRAEGLPTIPSTIALERATNPFVRSNRPELADAAGQPASDPVAVFAALRLGKDNFKG